MSGCFIIIIFLNSLRVAIRSFTLDPETKRDDFESRHTVAQQDLEPTCADCFNNLAGIIKEFETRK